MLPKRLSEWAPPLYSHFFFPDKPGTYPFFFFIPGLYGDIPAYAYSNLLESFAKKGFVVGVAGHIPDARIKQDYDLWMETFDWFLSEGNKIFKQKGYDIQIDFEKIVMGSHSSACELHKYLSNEVVPQNIIKGHWYLDPVFEMKSDYVKNEILMKNVETTAHVKIQESELCEICCLGHKSTNPLWEVHPFSDIKFFQRTLHCGHCSPLNHDMAMGCTMMCNVDHHYNTASYLEKIRNCEVGHMTAFFTDALYGDEGMRKYYMNVMDYCGLDEFIEDGSQMCEGKYCL